jgi:hypothetical protein
MKFFSKIIKKWNPFRKVFILLFLAIILILFGVYLFSINRMEGDAASHLLLAVSPILKIGFPYKDFWEIKPPMWPLVLFLWSSLFGFKMLSMRVISFVVALLSILIIRLIYKKIFQTPVFEIVLVFTAIIFLSPILYEFMLPTEMLGLLFSVGALLALISFRKDFPKFYISGLLFFAASQTKEPFTFTIIAALPIFIESLMEGGFSRLAKNILQFSFGALTCFLALYVYLTSFGSTNSYIEVFRYKQNAFSFDIEKLFQNFVPALKSSERTFTEFSSGFFILFVLSSISFYFVNKYKKILSFNLHKSELAMKPLTIANPEKINKYSVFLYALGSFMGFGIGGSFGHHYLIQVVVPFYIISGFIISYLFNSISFLFNKSKKYFNITLLLFIFSVVVMMPKRQYLYSYKPEVSSLTFTEKITGFEKRIAELTTKDQCVLSVYGWGASENYLYSGRRPCTRYFLTNIVREDWQKKEYAEAIVKNPPAVIYYRIKASDMDTNKFESEVINISNIINNCYVNDEIEKVLYVPKIKDEKELRKCIETSTK